MYRYRILPKEHLVVAELEGEITDRELHDCFECIKADRDYCTCSKGLIDYRNADTSQLKPHEVHLVPEKTDDQNQWSVLMDEPRAVALALIYASDKGIKEEICFSTIEGVSKHLNCDMHEILEQ